MNKLVVNGLNIQFILNECIVKFCNDKAIMIASCEKNLYEVNFMKVHEVDGAILMQSPMGDIALELWHRCLGYLNVKGVHTFQNMASDMYLDMYFLTLHRC